MIKKRFTKIRLNIKKPITVALLGDLHIKKSSEPLIKEAVKILNDHPTDIICLIGDFIQDPKYLPLLNLFSQLRNKKVFAVLGSHDFDMDLPWQKPNFKRAKTIENLLKKMGIQVLRDKEIKLKIRNQTILIAGVEDLWVNPLPRKKFNQVTVLLSHNPDIIFHKISKNASLILSGHTHGGSINFFPIKKFSASISCRAGAKKQMGLLTHRGRRVFITAGIGKLLGLIRIGIDPEIVFLTLTPN